MNNQTNDKDVKHHVVWADRIGLNKLWAKDILSCSETFGTPFYENNVKRFRNDIINIKNGPQLRSNITHYVDSTLEKWKKDSEEEWIVGRPEDAQYDEWLRDTQVIINRQACEHLCNFMIQLLENHGFGFYESADIPKGKDGYQKYDRLDNEYG